jgi:phosphate starvation-inducible protein PhoH and related proteins
VRNDPQLNAHFVRELVLEPADNQRLANLCGQFDEHLQQIERRLGVSIRPKGNRFEIEGPQLSVQAADRLLTALFEQSASENISPQRVHAWLQESGVYEDSGAGAPDEVRTRRAVIRGRGPNQALYLQSMREKDLCFGIGPAGTGKTYLAVARAVEALERDEVRRIVLVRPAVEAGERLGFLPGDLSQKVDPYLRPMYDALYEMVGFERVAKLIERHVIEIAPLAFMRGRTLNEAFVILDEAQNSTVEQMKMFLTRIGFGSRAVVNGDVTQTDLPATKSSGLRQAIEVLKDVEGVGFTYFTAKDVVRHPLVQRIVEAYQRHQGGDG